MLNKSLLRKGDTVGVALSGGKDSICLLSLLLENSSELGITVKAINVDHSIRGEDSERDSQFVKEFCEQRGIPLAFAKFDCVTFSKENSLSLEEGARKLRYDFFKSQLESGFCNKIATAHHLSDFVETVLFNLFRGVSPSGLNGIAEKTYDGKIIRPLISVTREQIDEYILKNNLPFVSDSSNFETDYTRNFLRLTVIPQIKTRFPEMEGAIKRFSDVLATENKFLDEQSESVLIESDGEISIPCSVQEHIFSRASIVAMKKMGILKDYEKIHVDSLLLLLNASTGKTVSLPKGVTAVKDKDRITLYKKAEKSLDEVKFSVGENIVGGRRITVFKGDKLPVSSKGKSLFFDGDKIPKDAIIRYRKIGDEFTKFGGGTKSLGDYFTDLKIPERKRDFIPLVAVGNQILIVCGIEISDKIKTHEETKNILNIIIN